MRDLSNKTCYEKAQQRGDQTFTVVGRDMSSPRVICEWIKENIETCPEDKLHEALNTAISMRQQPNRRKAD